MTSLTPIGTPASRPGRPARSAARAWASACSGSSQTQALTSARALGPVEAVAGERLGGQRAGRELRRRLGWR